MQPTHQVLIVADRSGDPAPLVDALRKRAESQPIDATVLVPATLRGLQWAGDPGATGGDAGRHAALLQVALLNAGVRRCDARVGDPDPHAAIDDALRVRHFDEVLISVRSPRLATALNVGLAERVTPPADTGVTYLRPARERRRHGRAGRAIARLSRIAQG